MKEFLLVIRRDITSSSPIPTPEQMKTAMKPYKEWIDSIAAADKLVALPKRWDVDGRVVKQAGKHSTVKQGPFGEGTDSIGGLFLIKADDYDAAVEIAKGCPIIEYGAIVEVRMAVPAA